jgi:catechol 2,3-dioxygenase-like lactoylglutathione lyase family enzyme
MSEQDRPQAGLQEHGGAAEHAEDLSSPRASGPSAVEVPDGEYPPPPEELREHTPNEANGPDSRAGDDIDHVDIRVSDVEQSRAFYTAALAPLGWRAHPAEKDPAGGDEIGFGRGDGTRFAIHSPTADPGQDTVTTGAHIAFRADGPGAVREFHAAALSNGGRDIGQPGTRNVYSAGYYGAFVLDPDGNNIEAVWHDAQASVTDGA